MNVKPQTKLQDGSNVVAASASRHASRVNESGERLKEGGALGDNEPWGYPGYSQ